MEEEMILEQHPTMTGVIPASSKRSKRDGRTREHYQKQKRQSFSYFRINIEDLEKIKGFQFNIFDFVNATFALSHVKKQLTIEVMEALKEENLKFSQLQKKLKAKKSTLYLLTHALEKSGFIERKGRNKPYQLSDNFELLLEKYASFWKIWKKK